MTDAPAPAPVSSPRAARALERSPLAQLTLCRVRGFFREPSAVFWTFAFPLLLTIALGIAFRTQPPEPVRAAVEAGPGAEPVRAALSSGRDIAIEVLEPAAAQVALRTGRVSIVIVPGNPPTYRFDPTRPESRLARAVVDELLQRAAGRADALAPSDQLVTEPGTRYVDFLVPGLLGMNIMSASMWGVGWVIVEDRQKKLLRRMVATPMRRSDYLLSFVFMRLLFLVLEVPILVGFGVAVFGVPLRGSLLALSTMALLGALAFAGLGLLVASRAKNTQTASGLMNVVQMPMFILSGVFFSADRFPGFVQPLVNALPLTALNDAFRAVMNEGTGLAALWPQAALLAVVAVGSFGAALRLFRWS